MFLFSFYPCVKGKLVYIRFACQYVDSFRWCAAVVEFESLLCVDGIWSFKELVASGLKTAKMLRQRHTDAKVEQTERDTVIEKQPPHKSKKSSSGSCFFKILAVIVLVLYVVVPLAFYLSPDIRRHAVFLHYVSLSRNKNLSVPSEVGLNCTRNFYVNSDEGVKLGTWHVPPLGWGCDQDSLKSEKEFVDSFRVLNYPVFLYLHGNAGTRGGAHRVHLYKVLSEKVKAHVIAFDYRGYGDSTNIPPCDDGIVSDAMHVYRWLRQHVEPSRILVWGHSLGTGVATALMEELSKPGSDDVPAGLILEAPFTKLIDAVKHHPLSFLHRYMPFFDFFFSDPIGRETSAFNSINRIGRVRAPVLILHAEDDGFVPFYQGKQLYEQALAERPRSLYATQFVGFEKKFDYGHKNIYKNPTLPETILQFMSDNMKLKQS